MSAIRRFFNSDDENSIFRFTIDTTKIVSGATNGSQNPLTFAMPLNPTVKTFIVRVSDGRPDTPFDGNHVIAFANPGIYTITLIGRVYGWTFARSTGYDKRKLISIDNWGYDVVFGTDLNGGLDVFKDCVNLVVNASNSLKLRKTSAGFFTNIKGFSPSADLRKYDVSDCATLPTVSGLSMPLYTVFSAFINTATSMNALYKNTDLSAVDKIEVISTTVNNIAELLWNSNFHGELIIRAPVTAIGRLLSGVVNPPSLGKLDIRRVTTNAYFIDNIMSTTNVDATLLGWASLDWTGFTSAAPAYNFYGSKYSNTPSVIEAKSFLQSKGVAFSNLTMA